MYTCVYMYIYIYYHHYYYSVIICYYKNYYIVIISDLCFLFLQHHAEPAGATLSHQG